MKTKLTLALAAALTGTAFAAFQALLPEFKTEKQLSEWRAEMAAEPASQKYAAEPSAFYTGKPYVESSGAYAFKYRSYNPELARWTSEDPSGFPDGANQNIYAPTPTSELDFEGLLKWSTLTNTNTTHEWVHIAGNMISDVWTVTTNDGAHAIELWKNTRLASGGSLAGYNYKYNCFGYVFGNSEYWMSCGINDILTHDYTFIGGDDKTGAIFGYWAGSTPLHAAKVDEVSPTGVVTLVTGKLGAEFELTSSPAGQGFGTTVLYYE